MASQTSDSYDAGSSNYRNGALLASNLWQKETFSSLKANGAKTASDALKTALDITTSINMMEGDLLVLLVAIGILLVRRRILRLLDWTNSRLDHENQGNLSIWMVYRESSFSVSARSSCVLLFVLCQSSVSLDPLLPLVSLLLQSQRYGYQRYAFG